MAKSKKLLKAKDAKFDEFYVENYEKYKSPTLNVGLIPKSYFNKDKKEEVVPAGLGLIETISYVMNDGAKQYEEHVGNVSYKTIPPEQIKKLFQKLFGTRS
jgi:hypothetical protein